MTKSEERRAKSVWTAGVLACLCIFSPLSADTKLPPELQGVGLEQKLNAQIPLDLAFRDETGKTVRIDQYFHSKPVILILAYYQCPMLCTYVLNGALSSLRVLSFDAGKDFDVLIVSFDPKDTSQLAAAKKANYVREYKRPGAENGWHFLTGDPASIDSLTKAVGFHYQYDAKQGQFAHASGIMVVTPQGRVSHYF